MAELNYNDMQRAVNEGVGQIRGSLNELRNNLTQLSRDTDDVASVRQQLDILSRRLSNIEQQLQSTQQMVASKQRADRVTDIMAQQVNEMRARFGAIEKFALQVSDYMQRVRAREEEDEGYKRVSG